MTSFPNRQMPRTSPQFLTAATLALALAAALALPSSAEAQRAVRRDGGGPAGGGSSGGSSSGSSGGSSGGSSRREAPPSPPSGPSGPSSSGGSSAPRGGGSTTSSTSSGSGASDGERTRGGSANDVPSYSRPREGQPSTGTAVARRGAPPYGNGGDDIYYGHGGYYPWGYGGFGFGGYYGSYYDPWYGYDAYDGGQYYADLGDGALRLKVKPREATVYADGYYVGRVDDFDGVFQRLHLEPGPHRIEIRADGYETLEFEVRLLPDRTLTYEAELRPRP